MRGKKSKMVINTMRTVVGEHQRVTYIQWRNQRMKKMGEERKALLEWKVEDKKT